MVKYFSSFNPAAREMVTLAMNWQDQFWDPELGLLQIQSKLDFSPVPSVHHVRESIWYALGLLQRDAEGDRARAWQTIRAVLRYQFDEPGKIYDGTWRRYPEEPHPGDYPPIWRGYDPNWREFIGSTLVNILLDYEPELPSELITEIDTALHVAVRGALTRGLSVAYTNIALMHAFLLDFTGKRFQIPEWVSISEQFAREIYALFKPTGTFSEFNCPTYYGVDLYALGLWRTYSSSALLRELGAEMEAALWKDIALMYHAGLKNMAGPFDRTYGMDMQQYVSLIGMWLWPALGRDVTPFPEIQRRFGHDLDFCFAPCYVAVGVKIPEEVTSHLQAFQGERQVERIIAHEPRRVAHAWLGENVLLGGEETSFSKPASDQFHPVTIQWRDPQGRVGWVRLLYQMEMLINAGAEKGRIAIACKGDKPDSLPPDFVFQIYTPDKSSAMLQGNQWRLAGLSVGVETNVQYAETLENGDYYEVRYTAKNLAPGKTAYFVLIIDK
jgi:hypothetical protein